jgi:hypothetical protein
MILTVCVVFYQEFLEYLKTKAGTGFPENHLVEVLSTDPYGPPSAHYWTVQQSPKIMYLTRQTADFTAPVSSENHGQQILEVAGCFTAAASIVVFARLYVRSVMKKTMGSDDWIISISLVSLVHGT